MSSSPYVLLPPSEAKETGGHAISSPGPFDQSLATARANILRALSTLVQSAPTHEVGRILKARGELLERALESTRLLVDGSAPLLPAWQRFSGVVWSHLDPATLNDETLRRVLDSVGALWTLVCD